MRIIAYITVRNERACLANCLTHLIEQGVDYFIVDNESDDGSLDLLAQPRFAAHLAGLIHHPYDGVFDWTALLERVEEGIASVNADWVLLLGADEVPHPYTSETLAQAIARLDAAGCDAINFNEFVFLPIDHAYQSDYLGPQPMSWYYFHEPQPNRLIRARRKSLALDWISSGGHRLDGGSYRLAEESLALRHYLFKDQEHALEKYSQRAFPDEEVARGWHRNRMNQEREKFIFPDPGNLSRLSHPGQRELSRERPYQNHYWQWGNR